MKLILSKQRYICFLLVVLVLGISTHSAYSQALSAGCENINDDGFEWIYIMGGTNIPRPMYAGEVVTMIADYPARGISGVLRLEVNGVIVDTSDFPGILTYTIPADGDYLVEWRHTGWVVTWVVTCEIGSPQNSGVAQAETEETIFVPLDERINRYDSGARVAVYANDYEGIDIYTITEDSIGILVLRVTGEEIDTILVYPNSPTVIASSGAYILLRLPNGDFEVQAPDFDNKTYYLRFSFIGLLVPYYSEVR